MFRSIILCVILLCASVSFLYAQVNQEWVARYNSGEDYASALVVDDSGNVYVTGKSVVGSNFYDYTTIKYNALGDQLWVARYNGVGGSGDDEATSIAIDNMGNVYVTGSSHQLSWYDYATVKYDSNGNQLWVARYVGSGNGTDSATSIVVDESGNVYITGHVANGGQWDYVTIKYDTNGNQLWVATYNNSYDDFATDLKVDPFGNVYVTGSSDQNNGVINSDYATVKYNANGTQLWVARYNGTRDLEDRANALVLDEAGNVYITGYINGNTDDSTDYATIKYNSDGDQIWVSTYDGLGSYSDEAHDIALDAYGNVFVTGTSFSGLSGLILNYDFATIKYNNSGNQLWIARYDGPNSNGDGANALAVDSDGNVYVTGISILWGMWPAYGYEYATVKYDARGNEQWAIHYGEQPVGYNAGRSIALDRFNNVYVTGESSIDDTDYDYATIKYVQGPIILIVLSYRCVDTPVSSQAEFARLSIGEGNLLEPSWSGRTSFVSCQGSTQRQGPGGAMTDQQQSINLRQQAMNLHESGWNVTQICATLGKSRTWFYKWFNRYRKLGPPSLQNLTPIHCPANRTPLDVEGKVLDIIMQYPNAGPETIALRLKQQKTLIGKTAVHGIMKRNHLNKRQQRLERLRILSGEVIKLSDLETARQKAKHRHIQAENPGDLVCLDLFYVGCLKGIGRIYQMTACDAATSFAWAQLYTDKSVYAARDFLAHILIESHHVQIKAILTDNGKEFTTHWQSKNHKFENLLRKLNVIHRYTQVRHPWTNGFVERLNRTILEEFYQVALRKKIYCTLDDLQIDLDQFLNDYNFNRPHQGYRLKGRCPADLFCRQPIAA